MSPIQLCHFFALKKIDKLGVHLPALFLGFKTVLEDSKPSLQPSAQVEPRQRLPYKIESRSMEV